MFRCAKHGMEPNISGLIAALHVVSVAVCGCYYHHFLPSSCLVSSSHIPDWEIPVDNQRFPDQKERERDCVTWLTVRDCLTLCYGNLSPAQLRSYFPPCTAQFSIDLQTFQITNYKLSWLAWMEWRVDLIQHNYKCYNVTDCQQPTQCWQPGRFCAPKI